MIIDLVPDLSADEVDHHFLEAEKSERKRFPKILHNQGDYYNKVVNFVLDESYMQPHLHPGDEKIEKMFLVEGSFALVLFDNNGDISDSIILEKGGRETIDVPAFTWHTYIMLTKKVVIYETMEGVYEPSTWKEMASWAPLENTPEAFQYLRMLKTKIVMNAVV
ncbi:WbuC family cupin fold metalloprotein [Alphaproteobacteria bacterium]|nr:WbuC family cupin fold metalloprotein [Alphaproteobacteria bacterium]